MIFARRAIQRRLEHLRGLLDSKTYSSTVKRLNRPGKDRMAAMWEVVVLHALARCGDLQSELSLPSGSCPDIFFENGATKFTADITCVSDEGLDDQNPFRELTLLVAAAQSKSGLPSGGVDIRALHDRRGAKTVLRLPPRKRIADFVKNRILPKLREFSTSDAPLLEILIDDEEAGVEIRIDRAGSMFSSGSHAPYDAPTVIDGNTLYRALKAKADQLRGAEGVTGVIAADGGCAAFASDRPGQKAFSAQAIGHEFLRQHTSVDFVFLLSVREQTVLQYPARSAVAVRPVLVTRDGYERRFQLETVFEAMLREFPKPVNSSTNGALRAAEAGYDFGHHGEYETMGNNIRVSARELVEVLAGLRTFDDNGARNIKEARKNPGPPSPITVAFRAELEAGRLPVTMSVVPSGENDDDDWIVFEFGDPDPAIARFT